MADTETQLREPMETQDTPLCRGSNPLSRTISAGHCEAAGKLAGRTPKAGQRVHRKLTCSLLIAWLAGGPCRSAARQPRACPAGNILQLFSCLFCGVWCLMSAIQQQRLVMR